MQKIALRCDVCDGPLTMQSGGQTAVCEYCGTRYALERLREKVQEIHGKVSIEGPVKTSHEDFEIHAGVLTKYHGADTEIIIPANVREIAADWIDAGRDHITLVTLPQGLTKIHEGTFSGFKNLKKITLPNGMIQIGYMAFAECVSLEEINIPDSVTEIKNGAFWHCENLKNVILSTETYGRLCPHIEKTFGYYIWEWKAFSSNVRPGWGSSRDRSIVICFPNPVIQHDETTEAVSFNSDSELKKASPWYRQIAMQTYRMIKTKNQKLWKQMIRCRHCGGKFRGAFTKTCEICGRNKDY